MLEMANTYLSVTPARILITPLVRRPAVMSLNSPTSDVSCDSTKTDASCALIAAPRTAAAPPSLLALAAAALLEPRGVLAAAAGDEDRGRCELK